MFKYYFLLVFLFASQLVSAQILDSIAPLNISESSGLVYINGKLFTHTDSGGEAAILEIDTITAQITKTVYIKNAINTDWEDIAQDNDYIYIGDFGNNLGNRTNLAILKLDKINFFNAQDLDSVNIEKIEFFYEDQTNFNAANQNTAFDAEALISFEDSLYIFTKNWTTETSSVYALPKTIGNYSASKVDSFNVEGLITGASIHPSNNKITLSAYTKLLSPFIFEMKNFNGSHFFQGENKRYNITPAGSVQIEGICAINEKKSYVSSENFFTASAMLHQWKDTSTISLEDPMQISTLQKELIFYPNPTNNFIQVNFEFSEAKIFNLNGKLVSTQFTKLLDIKDLVKGNYFVILNTEKNLEKSFRFLKQ